MVRHILTIKLFILALIDIGEYVSFHVVKGNSIWIFSLNICTEILKDLNKIWDRETSKNLDFHKKDTKDQIKSDEED